MLQVREPLVSAPFRPGMIASRSAAGLVQVTSDERESDRRFVPGDEHVARLDPERTALSLRAVHDPDGVPNAGTMTEREHGCDEAASEVGLSSRALTTELSALATERADTQTDALMDLAEVLRVAGRESEAIPVVEDALRRYEAKEVLPAVARARALLEDLASSRDPEASPHGSVSVASSE